MPQAPIGYTFLPSEEANALGPRRGNLEGNLGQAMKILSLSLPRVVGSRSVAPEALLRSPGGSGSGLNPYSAAFEALLRAMSQRGPVSPQASPLAFDAAGKGFAPPMAPASTPLPRIGVVERGIEGPRTAMGPGIKKRLGEEYQKF